MTNTHDAYAELQAKLAKRGYQIEELGLIRSKKIGGGAHSSGTVNWYRAYVAPINVVHGSKRTDVIFERKDFDDGNVTYEVYLAEGGHLIDQTVDVLTFAQPVGA